VTDYEPYVDEPAEPTQRAASPRLQATLAGLTVLMLIAGLAVLLVGLPGGQDPSLQAPAAPPSGTIAPGGGS
jgi:hypothetical protein